MGNQPKLYIISIPGPDDIYAAPSYEVAQLMKESHDKSMTEWLAGMNAKGEMLQIRAEDMMAIIEECDDAEDSAGTWSNGHPDHEVHHGAGIPGCNHTRDYEVQGCN